VVVDAGFAKAMVGVEGEALRSRGEEREEGRMGGGWWVKNGRGKGVAGVGALALYLLYSLYSRDSLNVRFAAAEWRSGAGAGIGKERDGQE
jgi:hypothetical protein